MKTTNVVIAERAFLAREGFKKILEKREDIILKGEIKDGTDLWSKVKALKPDILVLGCNAQDFIEGEDLNRMQEVSPGTKILIISDDHKQENVLKLIKSGVLGYLTKECGENEILDALQSVTKGEKFFCNKILDVILEKKHGETKTENDLTYREIEIIKLIAERYSNQEIADKLFISIHTVYTHRKNIMKKLKLKSPVELILYAIDSGLIQPYQN